MNRNKTKRKPLGAVGLEYRTIRITAPFKAKKRILRRIGNPMPPLSWRELLFLAEKKGDAHWSRIIRDLQPGSWYELQLLARIISRHVWDHDRFEQLLRNYDPLLELPPIEAGTKRFIGKGSGTGSLQVYRRVELGGRRCFEKIYRNDALGLQKNLWFYDRVEPQLDRSLVAAPRLLHMAKGGKMSALYFEYLEAQSIDQQAALEKSIAITKHFITIERSVLDSAPADFHDFTMSYGYSLGVAGIVGMFEKRRNRLELFRQMEQAAGQCRRAFCHGDLSMANLSDTSLVIDFDECGIYPAGYDIAKMLLGYLGPSSIDEIKLFLERNFRESLGEAAWPDFLFSTLFFSLVLGSRKGRESTVKNELFGTLATMLQQREATGDQSSDSA